MMQELKAMFGITLAHGPFLAAYLFGYMPSRLGAAIFILVIVSLIRKCVSTWTNLIRGGLSGKHVVITGGSQGLGYALAALCVEEGAVVTIMSRSQQKLEAAARQLNGSRDSTPVHFVSLDVSKASSAEMAAALERAAHLAGKRIDIFVANAGTGHSRLVLQKAAPLSQTDDYITSMVDLNLKGTLVAITQAAHAMAADGIGGRICFVSSSAGVVSLPGYAYYSATKFGLRGTLAGAYHELKRSGILLSCFFPGSILTPGYTEELEDRPDITQRIETTCSDTTSATSVAKTLLSGLKAGAREFSNELFPRLALDSPTGCLHIDLVIALVACIGKVVWDLYLEVVTFTYLPQRSLNRVKEE